MLDLPLAVTAHTPHRQAPSPRLPKVRGRLDRWIARATRG
jgi:hypothetical protein